MNKNIVIAKQLLALASELVESVSLPDMEKVLEKVRSIEVPTKGTGMSKDEMADLSNKMTQLLVRSKDQNKVAFLNSKDQDHLIEILLVAAMNMEGVDDQEGFSFFSKMVYDAIREYPEYKEASKKSFKQWSERPENKQKLKEKYEANKEMRRLQMRKNYLKKTGRTLPEADVKRLEELMKQKLNKLM